MGIESSTLKASRKRGGAERNLASEVIETLSFCAAAADPALHRSGSGEYESCIDPVWEGADSGAEMRRLFRGNAPIGGREAAGNRWA